MKVDVGNNTFNQLQNEVSNEIFNAIADQMGSDNLLTNIREQIGNCGYGQHDANWLSWLEYFERVCDLQYSLDIGGLTTLARTAGWWWAFDVAAVITERPLEIHRDDQGRLHNDQGPALMYEDGWGIWAVHGVRLPSDIIEDPGSVTIERIREERNVEIRRIMLEKFGYDRFRAESNATMVHQDDWGTLWRVDVPDDEPVVTVELVNSTPEQDGSYRHYEIRVPPHMRTAHEAVAWTYGMTPDQYKPMLAS